MTFKDITITNPKNSPGLILGNTTNPMEGLIFDNVMVTHTDWWPWHKNYYKCEGVAESFVLGETTPVPPCFE